MRLKTKADVIEDYIQQFRQFGPDVVDCFSHGMCYQFMTILRKRFDPFCTTPVYDEINGRIYDINGDITDDPQYHWKRQTTVCAEDYKHANRIRRDCVDKVPADTLICKYCDHCFYDEILNTYICDLDKRAVDLDTPLSERRKTRMMNSNCICLFRVAYNDANNNIIEECGFCFAGTFAEATRYLEEELYRGDLMEIHHMELLDTCPTLSRETWDILRKELNEL